MDIYIPTDEALDISEVESGGLGSFVDLSWSQVETVTQRRNWHHKIIEEALEKVSRGEIRNLLVMVPPGSTKTLYTGVFYPSWSWIMQPSKKFIYTTYGANLGLKAARQHRDLVNSGWFQDRWGIKSRYATPVAIPYQNTHAAAFFENTQKGFRFSSSTGGEVTGRHAHELVGDDLNKAQDALGNAAFNLTALDSSWEFWSQVLPTRQVDPATTKRILIGQRLHEKDVPGRWLESGDDIYVVCLPMRYDPDHPYLHPEDPRTVSGELLWPEHINEEEVEKLERNLGPVGAAAQLGQLPSPVGGAVFKRDWFIKFWKVLPGEVERNAGKARVHSWDHTFGTKGSASSYVVGHDWGRRGADYFLIDRFRDQIEFPAMRVQLETFASKHPKVIDKLIEGKASGKPLIQDMKHDIDGMIEQKADRSTGGKLARAQSITGLFEAGNIWLPHPTDARLYGHPHPCPWVHDFIDLVCKFRGQDADQSDDVDTMSQALRYLRDRGGKPLWARKLEEERARRRKRA